MSNRFRNKIPSDWLCVATIGRAVGLRGDLRLNIQSDFPEQFKPKNSFLLKNSKTLVVSAYDESRNLIRFEGVDNPEDAKKLTNQELYSTHEQTISQCELDEGEFFWFELFGAKVIEDDKLLGVIKDIERLGETDYVVISTDESLVESDLPQSFLVPYIDRYIIRFDRETKELYCSGAYDILKAS